VPRRTWRFRIEDILNAIRQIQSYTADMDFESFVADGMVVDAVL
jgi:uncharacterized protein with HEPN domain